MSHYSSVEVPVFQRSLSHRTPLLEFVYLPFLTAGLQTVFRVRNCRISNLSVTALLSMLRPWSSSQHALIWRQGPALLKLAGFLRVIPILRRRALERVRP